MPRRDSPWPQGTPCWLDLLTTAPDAAQEFYSAVFGWAWTRDDFDGVDYRTAWLDGASVCGLLAYAGDHPAVWNTYFATDDLQRTAEAVTLAGGTIIEPIAVAGDRGRFVVARDSAGAVVSFYEAAGHVGCEIVNEPGTLVWNELVTRDYEAAKRFYADVLGVTTTEIGDADQPNALLMVGENGVANIELMPASLPDHVPPHWRFYFASDDVDAHAQAALDAGGSVPVEPHDSPFGRWATLTDPHGGRFSVITPPAEQQPPPG